MTPFTPAEEARLNRDVARAMALADAQSLLSCLTEEWGPGCVKAFTESLAASLAEARKAEAAYDALLTAQAQEGAL